MSLTPPPPVRSFRLAQIFRSLRHRNYRLFFFGQGISLMGNWMTMLATQYLVYALTGSALLLGTVGFAGQFPAFLVTPWAGVMVDRWKRRNVLIVTQMLATAQSLALAALALTGTISVWHIVALSVFQGLINAFDIPARQTLVLDMVERKEDLGNAIALNSLLFNGSRFVAPPIAAFVIHIFGSGMFGSGVCFLLDGLSYAAVILCLIAMAIPSTIPLAKSGKVWHGLTEGLGYSLRFPPIRSILLLVGLMSFMGVSYMTLLPVYAEDILHGDARTLGFLMSAIGLGALAGGLYLASHPGVIPFSGRIPGAAAVFSVGLIGFSQSRVIWLSLPLLLLAGVGMMTMMATCNAVLQTIADSDKRGRVISLYTMAFVGMLPMGSLVVGFLASRIGAPFTLLIGGTACLTGAAVFTSHLPRLRELVRPIYARINEAL
jgi:MFS family permease